MRDTQKTKKRRTKADQLKLIIGDCVVRTKYTLKDNILAAKTKAVGEVGYCHSSTVFSFQSTRLNKSASSLVHFLYYNVISDFPSTVT